MRAGRLRHRVIVERPEAARDDAGSEVLGWREIATVWAGIEPLRGSEALASAQVTAELDTRVVLRWSPLFEAQLTAKCRVRHALKTSPVVYNVAAPPIHVNVGQREIQLLCKSGVNESQ